MWFYYHCRFCCYAPTNINVDMFFIKTYPAQQGTVISMPCSAKSLKPYSTQLEGGSIHVEMF